MIKFPISTLAAVILFTFSNPVLLLGAGNDISFAVIEHDDKTNGIECNICRIDAKNKEQIIDATDKNGNFKGNLTCKKGEKIKVNPVNVRYYPVFLDCPIKRMPKKIRVSKVIYISNLEFNALWLEKQGKFGDAALVNNEIYMRVKNFDEEKANNARIKALKLIAKQLNVDRATEFDTQQGKVVASHSLVRALKQHQQALKIEPNGKLDYNTLRSLSEIEIGNFLYKAREENNMF